MLFRLVFILVTASSINCFAQDVSLFQQFNGRYDYLAIGNTLNLGENGGFFPCDILTASSADLNLTDSQNIIAAYLYWAGSGNGDFDIKVNDIDVSASRTFSYTLDNTFEYFAAFADVTPIIEDQGNTTYTISEFDLTDVIETYCTNGTNFGGWALTVIYEEDTLPLNQINVYDGLQAVPESLTITLDNLNVLDNDNAKIGFIAWEGDRFLAVNEQLTINGTTIGNPPLNPLNNAFNGTNSFTGNSDLFNMDIDVYSIENTIAIGDTSATISLTSGQDLVMINNVITVLNSQLPDATITLDGALLECNSRIIDIDYTVYNTNSTGILAANTPMAFYVNNTVIGQTLTETDMPIGGSETGTITLNIPETIPDTFSVTAVVDDDGNGNGTITETNETNNTANIDIALIVVPEIETLSPIKACNLGFEKGEFNLIEAVEDNNNIISGNYQFYENVDNIDEQLNPISSPSSFENSQNPQTIFLRLETDSCYEVFQFDIMVENCPPTIPQGFSPNNDNLNDWFNIQGLYNVFTNHNLKIYNRLGTLVFEGNNNTPWEGRSNTGLNSGNLVPVGTYYYVLHLNHPNFESINGWVYVNY